MTLREKVIEMKNNGLTWNEMADELKPYYPELTRDQRHVKARNTYRREKAGNEILTEKTTEQKNIVVKQEKKEVDIVEILRKGTTLNEMSDKLGISTSCCETIMEDIKNQGYNVQQIGDTFLISNIVVPKENIITNEWHGEKVIRFGLMGDTQINSKYTQLTHLHKLYDIYKQEGITEVYHTGDIDEGEQMRIGHQYECYNQGADDHVKEIIRVYPHREGITTHFITGNHDASIIKRCGYDIGVPIAEKRADMEYLGQSQATINLTPNCTLELRHPIDGTAYALSYKLQKMIEAMSGGEKPNILAVGHYHKLEYFMFRNVHAFQTGCFQSSTPFTKGKNIAVFMGGWIIEAHVDEEGTITRLKQECIPFYKAIKDDWMNFR